MTQTPPEIERQARELLAAEMKAEWMEIYRDRETGEEPPEESWMQRAANAPASLRAIVKALNTRPTPAIGGEDVAGGALQAFLRARRTNLNDAELLEHMHWTAKDGAADFVYVNVRQLRRLTDLAALASKEPQP